MPLTCNIDARGKWIRLVNGAVLVVIGLGLLYFWAVRQESAIGWGVSIACILSGAFMVFEARAGWCVIRAMGFRTPL